MRSYEYIAVYVDDLCIAAESPSIYHLGADYFEDPDGTFVSQSKKYIDKIMDIRQTFLVHPLVPNPSYLVTIDL